MASDSSLKSLLTDDELSTINVQILDKLDIVFLKKENEIQEIKNDLVLSQTTNDRQIEELQKRLSEKENRLQQELVLSKSLQDQRVETEKRLSSLQSEITTLKESSAVVCGQLEQLKKDNLALSEEKSNLISVLKNKDKNIDELTNELKNVAEQLAAANQSKCDVLIKREELQTQELTLQYREKRLQQELKLANKQIDLSNAQINEKNQQLANITSEKVSEIFRLQNQVETNVDELKLSEEKVSNLTKMLEKQEKLGDSKNEQLQTLQKNSGQVEADYQHELRAQRKLADLYKKSNDDHECKVRELMKAVEELQKFIEQASFDHSELEGKYNTMVEQYEERLKEASKQIEDLNSELETANKLLSSSVSDGQVSEPSTSVADLYPEAVATSKVLRSYKSLTSLYSDFQRTEQELLKQKQENEELKQYLNNVLQEFDEKAPLLAQQKEDYEKALVTISVLNMKLDQAITDREQAYRERNNELRSAKFVTRENDRLKQKTTDLSSQVCLLLKEIEIYRGNYVPEDDQEVTSSCPSTIADESASSIIISKHLVSFRNIEELQKQNQQLLAVVRELSDEQEAKEKSAVDSRTSDLMTDLEAVKNQVGELKASRSRQETILESVVKQRDMYKTLLTETGPKQSSDEEVLNSKSLKDRSKEIDELNLTIQIMKEEGKRYKQDKDENFRILSEQMEAVRTELFETKLDNGRLTTQLQFSSERIEVLQTRLEASKKEVEMLQEKNNKLSTSVAKHEEVINCVKKEMLTIQSNLSRLEVSHQNLQSEHNLVKNREECLVQERDALMKERQSQGHILSNLQLLQANLERVEAERKLQMTNQIEKLEKDNEALRKKLDVERDEYKTAVDVWQKRNEEIRKQLDEALNSGQNRNSEHYKTLSELNELKNKLKEMESRSHSEDGTTKPLILSSRIETPSDRQRIESEQNESSINEMEDLKRSLSQADNRVKELASESDQKGEHLTHMTELTCQLETRLKETVEASDKVKKELQAKIDGISNQNAKYDDKINELLTKNEALTKKVEELNRISKSKDKDSKTVVDDLKIRFETATKDLQAEKLKLKQLTNDAEQQLKAASETEEKYKQVVLNHAKDLKLLNETETQLSSSNEIIAKAREAAQVAEQQLEGSRKSWKQQESMLVGNCEELSSKVKELENQNKLLYEQIELMNTQIMSLRSADHSSSSLDTSLTGDGNKNSNQLLEVVRYLRKEKDVQATQCEVLKAESVRLQTQLQHANKQLEAVEKQLFDARKRAEGNEAAVMSASKHRELIKKVEMLNLLSESNTTLRQQKQDAEDKIKELLGKVEQIERKVFQYQSMMNDIISQKDSAASENVALRNEIKRWQVRVEQLTEQANKITPEDLKKLNEELETLRKNVESLKKEGQRKAAEMSELRTLYESAKTEVNSLKEKVAADEKRIKELSDAIANKAVEKELADKKKLIVQVKSIAKKYKEHYQEAQNKNKDLEESIAESQSNSKQLQERIIRLEMQKNELEEAKNKQNEQEKIAADKLKQVESVLSERMSHIEKLNDKVNESNKEIGKVKLEHERNTMRMKKLLQKSQATINELKAEKDSVLLTSEESRLRLNTLQSKYEATVARQQQESAASNKQSVTVQTAEVQTQVRSNEHGDLVAKIEMLQKQMSYYQQQQLTGKPSTSSGPQVISSVSSETRTANIKPMSTPATTPARHATVTQRDQSNVGSSQPSSVTSRTHTPTASIRPMAIGSASSSVTLASPRMAAVMPTSSQATNTTVVSPQPALTDVSTTTVEVEHIQQQQPPVTTSSVAASNISPPTVHLPQATVAPSAVNTATVSPSVATSTIPETQQQVAPTVAIIQSMQENLVQPLLSSSDGEQQQQPSVVAASSSSGIDEQPTAGTVATMVYVNPHVDTTARQTVDSQDTPGQSNKRPRDDLESATLQDSSKRSKVNVSVASSNELSSFKDSTSAGTVSSSDETPSLLAVQSTSTIATSSTAMLTASSADEADSATARTLVVQQQTIADDGDDVIIVESDDNQSNEDDDDYEDDEAVDEGTEEDQPQSSQHQDDQMSQDYESDDDDEMDDDEDDEQGDEDDATMSEQQPNVTEDDKNDDDDDDDDDIEIIEDDEMMAPPIQQQEVDTGTSSNQENNVASTTKDNANVVQWVAPSTNTSSTQQTSATTTQMTSTVTGVASQRMPVPVRSERLTSIGRQQVSPFIMGQGTGDEEGGDDGIVPSTPTLYVPRRNDGFAEAVSSPQVPQSRFVFNQNQESSGGASLATQALGMDDTRVDLHFDDANSGRSVPTTPLLVSPHGPEDSITDVVQPSIQVASQISSTTVTTNTTSNVVTSASAQSSLSLGDSASQSMSQSSLNLSYSPLTSIASTSANTKSIGQESSVLDLSQTTVSADSCNPDPSLHETGDVAVVATSSTATASNMSTSIIAETSEIYQLQDLSAASSSDVTNRPQPTEGMAASNRRQANAGSEMDQAQTRTQRRPIVWDEPSSSGRPNVMTAEFNVRQPGSTGLRRARRSRIRGNATTRGRFTRP